MTQLNFLPSAERRAIISPCERYRYALWRRWGDGYRCFFCGEPLSGMSIGGLADETERHGQGCAWVEARREVRP